MYDRPIPERHRIVFYVGHLEAFDWNLLNGAGSASGARPGFDSLFAFGIDPVDGDLPTDKPADWPALSEVHEYRDHVRSKLERVLAGASAQLLNVAIEHRLMHAETLAYILHQLPFDRKNAPRAPLVVSANSVEHATVRIPAGCVTLGLPRDSHVFGWDNEFEEHTVTVSEFSIDKFPVTNGQFLQFLSDGGYQNRALWNDADWAWRCAQNISHPSFWVPRDGAWNYKSMFEEIALPSDWPVYVSHAEASAYARWANKRLPTEAEWQRAVYGDAANEFTQAARDRWDPLPVNAGRAANAANGWEWTSTPFAPFNGFQPFACYPGYSEPFFDGKHFVLKGGSVRTAECMLRRSFRNWFQPHYQYVYSGFRCVTEQTHDSD
jgi:ergothioneine biosynthesis protein EgtB